MRLTGFCMLRNWDLCGFSALWHLLDVSCSCTSMVQQPCQWDYQFDSSAMSSWSQEGGGFSCMHYSTGVPRKRWVQEKKNLYKSVLPLARQMLKGGVWKPKMAEPHTRIEEEPPTPGSWCYSNEHRTGNLQEWTSGQVRILLELCKHHRRPHRCPIWRWWPDRH